ncbi:MAG TPA: ABC transporter permease [Terriglobia bacterium]|nr:ABC transporter permease [Terriglobia bacterium]
METLSQDFRYALRNLWKSPRFTAVAILALAVGIGANTAIFSLINAVLLQPMPAIEHPEELVSVYRMQPNDEFSGLGHPDYTDYRDRNQTLSGLAAFCATPISISRGTPERLIGNVVSGNYFSVLGVKAQRGRLILPEDDSSQGALEVVVLSYGLWERKFAGAGNVVGSQVDLNGFPFTVIGVTPPQFAGTVAGEPVDVWVPMNALNEAMPRTVGHHFLDERSWGWLEVFGRLKPGVTLPKAEAELKGIAKQLELAYPQTNKGRTVTAVHGIGLDPDDRANFSQMFGLLFAGVALLLLIACANVAGLLLVRAAGRQREIAVRLALGATRARIVRQLLTEGILLALAGGGLGLLLAPNVSEAAASLMQPSAVLRSLHPALDVRVLVFTLLASVLTGTVFTLVPALQASKSDLTISLKQGTAGSGRRHSLMQRVLAAGQVAVTFVLLMGAGLSLRSLRAILTVSPGFDARNILLGRIDLSIQGYSPTRGKIFYRQLLERLQASPGVLSASMAMTVPPQDWSGRVSIFRPGEEPPQEVLRGHEFELGLRVDIDPVAPNYFRTMGIPLFQGRDFKDREGAGGQPQDQDGNLPVRKQDEQSKTAYTPGVVIVNQRLAERLWPGENAIGKRISWPSIMGPPRPPMEVIGVAADSKYRSLAGETPLLMYVPLFENYDGRPTLILRTSSDPEYFSTLLRSQVSALDKNLPVFGIKTMEQQVAFSLWQQRMAASLVSAFGLVALILAMVGLYGVVAHSVALRTHEMGIRVALGARPPDILKLVLREGMTLALAGMSAGILAALALTRLMAAFLYGVGPTDPVTFAAVSFLLGAVALAASYFPARQATGVDPIVALRYE